jgi:hypothetical protein
MLKKIISGGQTDADHAVLDAAIKLGIPYGGWIPKGRMTETGPLHPKYKLQEWRTGDYLECIKQNVKDSNGTLIISSGKLTTDLNYARRATLQNRNQLLGIDLNQTDASKASSLINDWTQLQHIDVLYVIAPSIRVDLDVAKYTEQIIERALLLAIMEAPNGVHLSAYSKNEYLKRLPVPPKTVEEAIRQIISEMPLENRVRIANLNAEELEPLYLTLGVFVRNQMLRKDGNKELLESCRTVSGDAQLKEIPASFFIIKKLWEELRDTHKLRVVK